MDGGMIASPGTPVDHALRRMRERSLSWLLVAGPGNEMLGMITQTAILRYVDIYQTIAAAMDRGGRAEASGRA